MLPPEAERRAIERGAISAIRKERRGLKPGSYTFPRGWLEAAQDHNNPRR